MVNGRSLDEHFGNAVSETDLRMPFRVTGTEGRFNAMIKVEGGGVTGQAGAIRHGIARALLEVDPEANRLPLRQAGFLTRDPRMKETEEVRAQASPQGASVHQALAGRRPGPPMRALLRCARSLTHLGVRSLTSLAGAFAWTAPDARFARPSTAALRETEPRNVRA